jgi:hypothetical protein
MGLWSKNTACFVAQLQEMLAENDQCNRGCGEMIAKSKQSGTSPERSFYSIVDVVSAPGIGFANTTPTGADTTFEEPCVTGVPCSVLPMECPPPPVNFRLKYLVSLVYERRLRKVFHLNGLRPKSSF